LKLFSFGFPYIRKKDELFKYKGKFVEERDYKLQNNLEH